MPQLLLLPNKVLLQVIGDLSHGGLENFALTCKRILDLSWDAIQERKNTYSTIDCGALNAEDGIRGCHLFATLRNILLDDSISVYTRKLLIGSNWQGGPEVRQVLLEIENEISSALRARSYLKNDDNKEFQRLIMAGDNHMAIALLITLLPNLVSIEIREFSSGLLRCFNQIVNNISGNSSYKAPGPNWDSRAGYIQQDGEEKRGTMRSDKAGYSTGAKGQIQALSRVRDVAISCTNTGYLMSLKIFVPFLSLPSMRSLSGKRIAADHGFWEYMLPGTLNNFSITKIDFEESSIDARSLETLLLNISSLRHFRYNQSSKGGLAWEPYNIIESLSRGHSHSLVSLDLTAYGYLTAKRYGTDFIGYLKDFQVLKTVRLDNTILTKDYNKETENMAPLIPWQNVSSNLELLPITVTSLTLAQPFEEGVGRDLLKNLPKQKGDGLSGLKEITFEHEPGLGADLEEALKDAGIGMRYSNRA